MTQHAPLHDEHGHPVIDTATGHIHTVTTVPIAAQHAPKPADAAQTLAEKKAQIEHNYTYHAPKAGQPERYTQIREKAKELAHLIADVTPVSREQSLAHTHLETAVMMANAAIARHG